MAKHMRAVVTLGDDRLDVTGERSGNQRPTDGHSKKGRLLVADLPTFANLEPSIKNNPNAKVVVLAYAQVKDGRGCTTVEALDYAMKFPSVKGFKKGTLKDYDAQLKKLGVIRPVSPGPPRKQELALTNLWISRSLERLASQVRGAEFLPREEKMQDEADTIRAKVVGRILAEAPANLKHVRDLVPTKMPEKTFPRYYSLIEALNPTLEEILQMDNENPALPDITEVQDWLRELQVALGAHLGQAPITQSE